jgi:hypothetical protein
MNFGCQAEVFQLPHHRQYLLVTGQAIATPEYLKLPDIFSLKKNILRKFCETE